MLRLSFMNVNKLLKVIITAGFLSLLACTTPDQAVAPISDVITVPLPSKNDFFADSFGNGQQGPQMVRLPAFQYQRGCLVKGDCFDDDKPVRTVSIPSGVSIMTHEVNFEQYDLYATVTGVELPEDNGWGRGKRPVINVSWDDAVAYAEWLSEQTGKFYQLPTEAVWEYSARAGSRHTYHFGDDVSQLCEYANVADISEAAERNGKPLVNCDDGYGRATAPVASYKPNAFGIYDMSGNVREWVQDCYHDSYRSAPTDGSARLDSCDSEEQVLRGGAWFSFPWINGSATRQNAPSYVTSFSIGFRLMRVE